MRVLVIDGQGGGLGRQVVSAIKASYPDFEVIAIGTNSIATAAMLKAGADKSATGENPVVVCSKNADVIIGPIGIVIADSMLGEITEKMAVAVAKSRARRILVPVNLCDNFVVGVEDSSISAMVECAIKELGSRTIQEG